MMQSSAIQIVSDFGSSTDIVLGREKSIVFWLSNVSNSQKAYNVTAELIISDGLDLSLSVPAYTTVVQDAARRYTIRNFKDFSPLEGGISLTYVMESLADYLSGSAVDFGTELTANLSITWDSMPRGNYDAGNIQYYNIFSFSMTTARLSVTKLLPTKRVKGAGDENSSASKPFFCATEIINNVRESVSFTIEDVLPNGFRYLGDFSVVTPSQYTLSDPTIATDSQSDTQTLDWDSLTLLAGETVKFGYNAAIYDRYMQDGIANTGEVIPHGTLLSGTMSVTTPDYTESAHYSIAAMDLLLSVSQDKNIVDCGDSVDYTLVLEANQYHDLSGVSVRARTPDGQTPTSYPGGSANTPNSQHEIPVNYLVGAVAKNTSQPLSLVSLVQVNYRADSGLVACGDEFTLSSDASGINTDISQTVSDSASISQSIVLPVITKVIFGKYYRSMLPKSIPALAPLDYIEYELTYDSTGIQAAQLAIILDDFFPLDSSLPDVSDITRIAGSAVTPLPVAPHGLRWSLGDVATGTVWKIRTKSQISAVITTSYTVNLFKLTGQNHSGESYSGRTDVSYQTGVPNIVVSRSITGIDVSKVESLQRYTASITFTNMQNAVQSVTDAFHFDALAQLGGGIEIDTATIATSGTGAWGTPIIDADQVSIAISRLKVGESVTISYQAVIPADIPPSYSALLVSQLEVPHTQPFRITQVNVKYAMDAVISDFSLRSSPLIISKNYDAGIKQVGGNIDYSVNVTIPKGTAVFQAAFSDTLPSEQAYSGNASVNGTLVAADYNNHVVSFPVQDYLYRADADLSLTYTLTATVQDAAITSAGVTQRNNCFLSYTDKENTPLSVSTYKDVTISNPKISLSLSGTSNHLSSSAVTSLSLTIANVGRVTAAGVAVKVAIPAGTEYISVSSSGGVPVYDAANRLIRLSLASVAAGQSVTLSYVVKGTQTVQVGDSISMTAQTDPYTNQLSDLKLYPSALSNSYLLIAYPGTLLTIYPPYRSQSGGGYVQVSANSIAIVPYTLVNQGGGSDSFRLSISASKYPYDIQIDGNIVASVDSNRAYNGVPAAFVDLPSGSMCKFNLIFAVPQVQLYDRNPYTVTVESLYDSSVRMSNNTEMVDP